MLVLKFGGSSVGSVDGLNHLKTIAGKIEEPCIVVVSAITGVTDLLQTSFEKAVKTGGHYREDLETIRIRHTALAESMLSGKSYEKFLEELGRDMEKLEQLLSSVSIMKNNLSVLEDHILSMGEQFSSKMIVKMLDGAVLADGKELIVTKQRGGASQILWEETCGKVKEAFRDFRGLAVVPGFCGKTPDGHITTLGRGGSDLTAAMLAAATGAETVDIWTDVDGMMTADPAVVPHALTIPALSYSEAAELCHFGAKVLFTPAIWPAIKSGIPIRILNTYNPGGPSTLIDGRGAPDEKQPVKGITHIDGVALITVFGNGLMGQVGTSYRLFGAMADEGINIIFIAQASSEYSISFAVRSSDGDKAIKLIRKRLQADPVHGSYISVTIEKNMAILAVVGNDMRKTPGIAGKIFGTLGKENINVVAMAQGGSELNVSAVVRDADMPASLRALHKAFFGK